MTISQDMMNDIAQLRIEGASWAWIGRMYGIPAATLKRAYLRKSREIYGI